MEATTKKHSPLIWKLAELSEKYGPKGECILLYKLALKHHRQGIDLNNPYAKYDSVETDKKEYYVPLEKYYQLVSIIAKKLIRFIHRTHLSEPMGEDINSSKEDYRPAIGNVDYILPFTSKRNTYNKRAYNEDLFF